MSHELPTLKVVLIDDAPVIVSHLESMLAPLEGVEVLGSAGNVADALALIERVQPNAIVLDLRLPDGSGTRILQHVKQNDDGVAVIVLTAHPSPPVRETCLALGADYFIDKSLEFRRVAQVLEELASKAHGVDGRASPARMPHGRQAVAESADCCTDEPLDINELKL